jgi:hypothetical protein
MSYSAVSLVLPFLFLIMYSLDYVLDLDLTLLFGLKLPIYSTSKKNSLVNFHDSLSRSASHNKHYTRQLQIADTAYIKA